MTASVDVTRVVIGADKLRRKLASDRAVVLLEVTRGAGAGTRLAAAHSVALESDLVGEAAPGSGNLPLPDEQQIQDRVRRWGIDADSIVVAYSAENPALAARAWWTLKWAGVPDVRVFDGVADEWYALDLSESDAREGTFVVQTGSLPTLDAETAAELARSGALLDARAVEGYVGEKGGGHIPGARSVPAPWLVDAGGRLIDDERLSELFSTNGADGQLPVGAYCGGGTSATLTVLALAKLGVTAALYPGSFSAYSSDPSRPVVTGGRPG